jgi:hypothetical protein
MADGVGIQRPIDHDGRDTHKSAPIAESHPKGEVFSREVLSSVTAGVEDRILSVDDPWVRNSLRVDQASRDEGMSSSTWNHCGIPGRCDDSVITGRQRNSIA